MKLLAALKDEIQIYYHPCGKRYYKTYGYHSPETPPTSVIHHQSKKNKNKLELSTQNRQSVNGRADNNVTSVLYK